MNYNCRHIIRTILVSLTLVAAACDTTVQTDEAETGKPIKSASTAPPSTITYQVDTAKSAVTWIGAKLTGRHTGPLVISHGDIKVHNDTLTGGIIKFDMTAVHSDDKRLDEQSNKKLTNHLRSPDFFDVEKHPTAIFELVSTTPYDSTRHAPASNKTKVASEMRIKDPTHRITGNLTVKGVTKSVSFPAKITRDGEQLKVQANFNIDRAHWGLVYRSEESLGNQTIYREVNIDIDLVTKAGSL
jgi:polyisoprenoid-binding protein YceI